MTIAPRGCSLVPYCEGRNMACPGFSGRETRARRATLGVVHFSTPESGALFGAR
jgi:hypothetical protein